MWIDQTSVFFKCFTDRRLGFFIVGIGRVKALNASVSPFLSTLIADLNHWSLAKNYGDAIRFFDPSDDASGKIAILISSKDRSYAMFLDDADDPSKAHGYLLSASRSEGQTYYSINAGGEVDPHPLPMSPFANEVVESERSDMVLQEQRGDSDARNETRWSMGPVQKMYSQAEPIEMEDDIFKGISFP